MVPKPGEEKAQPCNEFKVNLAGEYGICAACKFSKHQHSDEAIFSKFHKFHLVYNDLKNY